MIKINRHHFVRLLLLATTLPFGLLAADARSAHAGTVTVTGANGANGGPGKPGGAGGSATAAATAIDPSNSATATGGNGGAGGPGGSGVYYLPRPGAGGHGGAASSTASASNSMGPASAMATSTGGNGGRGGLPIACIHSCIPGAGGGGGSASAISSATGGGAGTVVSDATATGGAGGIFSGSPGHASAGAFASSTNGGQVEADASAFSWGGGASVTATAQNQSGSIATTAAAPPGSKKLYGSVAESIVGSAPVPVVAISAGQAFSNAALTPGGGLTIGVGAMSAGYVLSTAATYETTAVFNFMARSTGALDLDLLSYKVPNVSGADFDSLELQVVADGTTKTYNFNSLTGPGGAEAFFTAHPIDLGNVAAGSRQSVSLLYNLNYNTGTLAAAGDGFGFTYKLVDPPLSGAVPEPSTWAMLITGFLGLGIASWRSGRGKTLRRDRLGLRRFGDPLTAQQ